MKTKQATKTVPAKPVKATKQTKGNPHKDFFRMLALIPYETKESCVYQWSGQTHLSVMYEKHRGVYGQMVASLHALTDTEEFKRMNTLRKQVIASINGYFKLVNKYQDLSSPERLQKVKGTAVKSTGVDKDFNKLTKEQLNSVYATFSNKQKMIKRVDLDTLTDGVCDN